MNRVDFMKQLESLLQNISPAEREEALQYYNEYFNDAGAENEKDVIEALGNPAKVAENIKRDLYGSGYGDSAGQRVSANDRAIIQYQQNTSAPTKEESKMPTWCIVLIVILCVFASPAILGVGAGGIGTLVGLVTAWFCMILGFGMVALALIVTTIVLVVVGLICIVATPFTGVGLIGAGLICGAIGILFLMLTVAMAGIATPAICKGIASLCRKIFGKKHTA